MGTAVSAPSAAGWTDAAPTDETIGEEAGAFTIGELATGFGVTQRTLRFYESVGLIAPRRNGAARLYAQSDRDRIALIVQGKKLGFTLREIRDMLASPSHGEAHAALDLSREQCVEQINLLERQKRMIDNALVELRRTYSSHYTRELALRSQGVKSDVVDATVPAIG
jgi:DNA-binding transcriptional MerR regulator